MNIRRTGERKNIAVFAILPTVCEGCVIWGLKVSGFGFRGNRQLETRNQKLETSQSAPRARSA